MKLILSIFCRTAMRAEVEYSINNGLPAVSISAGDSAEFLYARSGMWIWQRSIRTNIPSMASL
ncbi:hypothetical protein L484_021982 [Morus notabilis]|uniref:Uncharacterized protein n=1 Tax=Morus notabilis TaxID=981085 RepID=W9QUZ2_9ROSA|nr:hypothetical protein L484_021982 [Morus notabilis]